MILSTEMIIAYALSGINTILLIIVLVKVFRRNKLPDIIQNNATAQTEKLNNLLNYIKQLEHKVAQNTAAANQTHAALQQLENTFTKLDEETKHMQENLRKEVSLTRLELNNQLLRIRQEKSEPGF